MLYGVVLDGSQNSKAAFEMALSLMSDEDQICLISIPSSTHSKLASQSFDLKEASTKAEILLQQFASVCDSRKIKNTKVLCDCPKVARQLCKEIEKNRINFLLMGKSVQNKLKTLLFGSTSDFVQRNACCSVVVIEDEHVDNKRSRSNTVH